VGRASRRGRPRGSRHRHRCVPADPEERARRRAKEVTDLDYETVASDLARRDALDTNRKADPLAEAPDAIQVDTTGLSIDEVVAKLEQLLI
jgi:cytidylate kinase